MRGFETAFVQRTADDHLLDALRATHAAFFEGAKPKAPPRGIIRDSWLRVRRSGLTPAHGGLPDERATAPRFDTEVEPTQVGVISGLLPLLRSQLEPLLDDDETLLVVTDEAGTVVARYGGRTITRRADVLGFRPGMSWSERSVGTNAIGTALATGAPVHVHAAEHFCLSHHEWSCAAAPVRDPRNGRPLGVIDLSFRATQAHPTAIVLAVSLARQSELALRDAHRRSLRRLREQQTATPATGSWLLVDQWGWIADSSSPATTERLTLPETVEGAVVVDGIGLMQTRRIDGGWLLSGDGAHAHGDGIRVHIGDSRCEVVVASGGHAWTHVLVGRRAEIVDALTRHPEGMSAQQLSQQVYGGTGSEVAVRAEVHRIHRGVGGLITTKPYRLSAAATISRA